MPHASAQLATHFLLTGYDIRTIQELLGNEDVSTTMMYTHALNRCGMAIRLNYAVKPAQIAGIQTAWAHQSATIPGTWVPAFPAGMTINSLIQQLWGGMVVKSPLDGP